MIDRYKAMHDPELSPPALPWDDAETARMQELIDEADALAQAEDAVTAPEYSVAASNGQPQETQQLAERTLRRLESLPYWVTAD